MMDKKSAHALPQQPAVKTEASDIESVADCIICLEPLLPCASTPLSTASSSSTQACAAQHATSDPATTAALSCGHKFHYLCLSSWAERINSCPTCRSEFTSIDILDKSGNLESTKPVCTKLPIHDDDDMDEALLNALAFCEDDPAMLWVGDACVICDTDGEPEQTLVCDGCARLFHVTCLGIGEIPSCDWYCPSCEILHSGSSFDANLRENNITSTSSTRRTRGHRTRNGRTVARHHFLRTQIDHQSSSTSETPTYHNWSPAHRALSLMSFLSNHAIDRHPHASRNHRARQRNVNRNVESLNDIDFQPAEGSSSVSRISSSALVPKNREVEQSPARESLTLDEQLAWDDFDNISALNVDDALSNATSCKSSHLPSSSKRVSDLDTERSPGPKTEKFKRPCRRHQKSDFTEKVNTNAPTTSGVPSKSIENTAPTLVQSLLSNMRSRTPNKLLVNDQADNNICPMSPPNSLSGKDMSR